MIRVRVSAVFQKLQAPRKQRLIPRLCAGVAGILQVIRHFLYSVFRKEKELSGNRCEEVVDAVVLPSAAHTYIDTLSAETADHIKISGVEDVGAVLYKCAVHIGCNQSDHGVLLLLV